MRVRTTSFKLAPAFCKAAFDILDCLHGLRISVTYADNLSVRPVAVVPDTYTRYPIFTARE